MDGPSSDSSKNTSIPREASEQEIRVPSVTPLSTHSGMMSGARWAALLQALGQAISWLSTIVVVRFVSPTDYGLFAMLESPLELLLLVALLGMDVALVRVRNIAPPAESAAFGLLLLIGGLMFCLFFFGAQAIAGYYSQSELLLAAQVLSPIFLITPFRVIPNAILDRTFQFKTRAQLELVAKVVAAACTLTLAYSGAGYWSLIVGVLTDRILYAALIAIKHPWIIKPSLHLIHARQLISFGSISAISFGIQLFTSKGAGIIAAPILGTAAMGIYAFATQFALLPLSKSMPILNRMLIPAFAHLANDLPAAAQRIAQAINIALVILAPIMIGLAMLAEPFVAVVFGPDWVIAAVPLAIYSAIMPLRLISIFMRLAITSLGPPKMLLASVLPPTLVVLPLTYWIAPSGATALVLLWCAAEPISLLVSLRLCQMVLPLSGRLLADSLVPPLVGVACLAAAVWGILLTVPGEPAAIRLLIGSVVGATAYLGAMALFFRKSLLTTYSILRG